MIFKCKNCGGNTIYSPEKKMMVCPYCDSEESYTRKDKETSYGLDVCPDCGGTIPVEQFDSAMKCPYCGNSVIFNERVEGEYLPKFVIPFELGKEKTKGLIRDRFKKFTFAPADFLSEARLDSMYGIYVPFWFFNFDTNAHFHGEGTKVRTWVSGNYRYTETSYYDVVRNMDIPFRKLPVDASIKIDYRIMDLMEPYDYQKLADFKPEYLSGFNAEYYNMTADALQERAQGKMKKDAEAILKSSITGYASVRQTEQSINVKQQTEDYGLMPVWRYVYEYKNQEYPFYVNGETGKIIGKAPLSKGKVWAYSLSLMALLEIIFASINGILGLL